MERLQKWSSYYVSGGLSKLGHMYSGFLEGSRLYSPGYKRGRKTIVGQAFSVKFASKEDKNVPKIDHITKAAVVFISRPAPHINACYGGLMSLRANDLGEGGVVIDGSPRDIQEHCDLEFPVSARSTGTTAGGVVCFPSEGDVPDGVVTLPSDLAEEVLELIPSIVGADEKAAEAIRGGMSAEDAFKTFRGKCKDLWEDF